MRAAIYNPYLDTLGGGERYSLAFADSIQKLGYDVFVQWKNPSIKNELEARFGIDLSKIAFIKDVKKGEGYDLIFWVSDGSIPLLHARKNFLHFQIPFKEVEGKSLINKMKMFRIAKVICNSIFTKNIIDGEFGIKSEVLYPPVDVISFKPKVKENIILSVARFSQLTQSKNQHVLVDVFKKMINKGLAKWKLVLAGGTEIGSEDYLKKLKKTIDGYPINIVESPSFLELKKLYGTSKIFWSAVGYGYDNDPKKVEHFGISVVEAMAAGCVPVVCNLGGHKETVQDKISGILWDKKEELIADTLNLIEGPKVIKSISISAIDRSKNFSYEEFSKKVKEIIK